MNKNNRASNKARHCYTAEYAEYLRNGDLEEATRQVAHAVYLHRGNNPGTPEEDWKEAERITREWPGTITEASKAHMFDKALSKSREWLADIEAELELRNPNDAYRALRAVLHALRDRLPALEAAEFAAQLPVLITGIYYTGWTPRNKPMKMKTMDEFLGHVSRELAPGTDPLRVTRGVINVLERRLAKGEIFKLRENFPETLKELLTAP